MLTRFILEALLQVAVIILLSLLLVKQRSGENYLRIAMVPVIYIVYQLVLVLPRLSPVFDFAGGNWNWDGKLLGIAFGVTCYFAFRRHFREHNYFTLRQDKRHFKAVLAVAIAVVIIMTVIYYFIASSPFDMETLAFQLTMPGIDEEILFRGILLGLLMSALKERAGFLGSPAVLLTGILFGLMHALTLDKDYTIQFEPVYFLHTGVGGYVFGWMTIKTRSIVLAVLTHGVTNFSAALATMLK